MMITYQQLNAARQGDLKSFNQLTLEIQDEIYNLISWFFPVDSQLEVITHMTIFKIYHSLGDFHRGNFKLWFYKMFVKECRKLFNEINGSGFQLKPFGLTSIKPDLALMLLLVELERLDYRQTAWVMGLPQWIIRRRLASARQQLMEAGAIVGTSLPVLNGSDA
jgi:DNA-directed RNA polymerase specialized sigma24 family protein